MITMMATKDDDKGDEKKLKGQSKDEIKMFKKKINTYQICLILKIKGLGWFLKK